MMGTSSDGTSSVYRGRMPVFSYLSEREAADVYEYLAQYPPTQFASANPILQPSRPDPANLPADPEPVAAQTPKAQITSQPASTSAASPQVPISGEQAEFVFLPAAAGLFVAALLVLGCCLTVRELGSFRPRVRNAQPRAGRKWTPRSGSNFLRLSKRSVSLRCCVPRCSKAMRPIWPVHPTIGWMKEEFLRADRKQITQL